MGTRNCSPLYVSQKACPKEAAVSEQREPSNQINDPYGERLDMDQNLVGCIGRNWLCPATVESRPLLSHGDTFIMAQPPYAEARRFPQLDWPLTSTAKAQLTHQKKEKFTYHADKL